MLADEAVVPERLAVPAFTAVPLSEDNFALDYAAYMASPDVIRIHSHGRWPIEGFSLEADRALVTAHRADHIARRAFTFTLLDPDETQSLGCVYLNPLLPYVARMGATPESQRRFTPSSAMVTFWIRQDRQRTDLPATVAASIHRWIESAWEFGTHVFRVRPEETSSCVALERLPLHRVALDTPLEPRHYRWYQSRGIAR
jgi:hypothetical protein